MAGQLQSKRQCLYEERFDLVAHWMRRDVRPEDDNAVLKLCLVMDSFQPAGDILPREVEMRHQIVPDKRDKRRSHPR